MLLTNYIYLKIPTSWKLVYDKLLVKMANLGEDLLKECNASCTGENREYIACWNMFQAACAAFEIGEYSKANTLISFICAKLEISLIDTTLIVYTGCTNDFRISQLKTYSLESHPIISDVDLDFCIAHNKQYHFVMVPTGIKLINSKYGPIGFETDIYSDDESTLYRKDYVTIDGIDYTIYIYYSPVGEIDEPIKLKFAFE